jgi:hypothetical protein
MITTMLCGNYVKMMIMIDLFFYSPIMYSSMRFHPMMKAMNSPTQT